MSKFEDSFQRAMRAAAPGNGNGNGNGNGHTYYQLYEPSTDLEADASHLGRRKGRYYTNKVEAQLDADEMTSYHRLPFRVRPVSALELSLHRKALAERGMTEDVPQIKEWDHGKFMDAEDARHLGDKRFRYVPFFALSGADRARAKGRYPHQAHGAKYNFIPEHYYYPVDKTGKVTSARARRTLAIPHSLIINDAYMRSLGYESRSDEFRSGPESESHHSTAKRTVVWHIKPGGKHLTASADGCKIEIIQSLPGHWIWWAAGTTGTRETLTGAKRTALQTCRARRG
jgi:hypothetical protein